MPAKMNERGNLLAAIRRSSRRLLPSLAALVGGVITYVAWMALFISLRRINSPPLSAFLWILAPFITATGLAAGFVMMSRLIGDQNVQFRRVLPWPLVGCIVGAAAVFGFGPMLIVFSMLAAGTVSIVLMEMFAAVKQGE